MSAIGDPRRAMHALDASLERRVGADLRLIYGMAAPILLIVGLIVVLAFVTSPLVVAAILVAEVGLLGVVLLGFSELLSESEEED